VIAVYRCDIAAARDQLLHPDVAVERLAVPWGHVEYARSGHGSPVLVVHGSGVGWDQGVDWARLLDVATGGHVLGGNVDQLRVAVSEFLSSADA
jgi:hypothetical protein